MSQCSKTRGLQDTDPLSRVPPSGTAAGLTSSWGTLIWREVDEWWPVVVDAIEGVREHEHVRAAPSALVQLAMVRLLRSRFRAIRLFHGCRPPDVDAYYREGIRAHGPFVLDRARELYRAQGIPDPDIDAAIEAVDLSSHRGRVFLSLDDQEAVLRGGQHLIYGGGTVFAIGAALVRLGHADAQGRLLESGPPILLTCEVPLSLLDERALHTVVQCLYDAYRNARGRRPRTAGPIKCSVVIDGDVPASAVRGHTSANAIPDPLHYGRLYWYKPPT